MDGTERSILGVTMVSHSLVHTFELSVPVLIPVWIAEFGVTPSTIGLLVGAGYALFGLGSVPAGFLSDSYRTAPLMALCLAGMGLAFLGISAAPSPAVLTLALLCWGLAASVHHPVALSSISRGVSRRGTAFGYHGIAGNVGVALGPLVTATLLVVFDWRVATAAIAVPGLVAAPFVARLDLDAAIDGDDATGSADGPDNGLSLASIGSVTRRTLSGLFVVVFVIVVFEGLYYRGALTFLPDLLAGFAAFDPVTLFGYPIEPSRYLYVGLLTVGIGGQYAGGWLSDRVDPVAALVAAFALLVGIAVLFVPAATAGVVPLAAVSALLGFVLFGEQPLLQATVARHSSADTRGVSYGFVYVGVFGVGAAGATITGFLLTYASADALFGFLALVAGLAAVTALLLYRAS